MTKQQNEIDDFIAELRETQQSIYLLCDVEVAADVFLKLNKAIRLIRELRDGTTGYQR